jgi:hypothetical protein
MCSQEKYESAAAQEYREMLKNAVSKQTSASDSTTNPEIQPGDDEDEPVTKKKDDWDDFLLDLQTGELNNDDHINLGEKS